MSIRSVLVGISCSRRHRSTGSFELEEDGRSKSTAHIEPRTFIAGERPNSRYPSERASGFQRWPCDYISIAFEILAMNEQCR